MNKKKITLIPNITRWIMFLSSFLMLGAWRLEISWLGLPERMSSCDQETRKWCIKTEAGRSRLAVFLRGGVTDWTELLEDNAGRKRDGKPPQFRTRSSRWARKSRFRWLYSSVSWCASLCGATAGCSPNHTGDQTLFWSWPMIWTSPSGVWWVKCTISHTLRILFHRF